MLESNELSQLANKWGYERTEDVMMMLVKAKDGNGMHILLEPTVEHVEKVMAAIYAPEEVTINSELIPLKGFGDG